MPDAVYTIVAKGARYWFLLLMFIIVWRSVRWYYADRKNMKLHLQKLPNSGFVGEMVLLRCSQPKEIGRLYHIPFEGSIGRGRGNDVSVKTKDLPRELAYFHYEKNVGLVVEKAGKVPLWVDQIPVEKNGVAMVNQSMLFLSPETVLCLHLYPEYAEDVGTVSYEPIPEEEPETKETPPSPYPDFAPEESWQTQEVRF